MISQANISPNTPMGANLVSSGSVTFRAWAPLASGVYINGTFGGTAMTGQTANLLFAKDANGYWTGFVATSQEGDPYQFWWLDGRHRAETRSVCPRVVAGFGLGNGTSSGSPITRAAE